LKTFIESYTKKRDFNDIIELERVVISALVKNPNLKDHIIQNMKPKHFLDPDLAKIYDACMGLYISDVEISKHALLPDLSKAQREIVKECLDIDFVESNIPYICQKVIDESRVRDIADFAEYMQLSTQDPEKTYDRLYNDIHERIINLVIDHSGEEIYTPKDLCESIFKELENRQEGVIEGVKSHIEPVDSLLGAFPNSGLIILASRPSFGKTQLALQISADNCMKGMPVLFFSLEMSEREIIQRLISRTAQINLKKISMEKLTKDELEKVKDSLEQISSMPLYFKSLSSLSVAELRAKAKRVNMQTNGSLGLIVVDYIQLMSGDESKSRNDIVGSFSRGMKQLAMEMHIPVLGLCQLNRDPEKRTDKRPMLADLRESGNIESDANIVMFLHKEAYYTRRKEHENDLEIIIRKNRNGPVGTIKVYNDPRTQNIKSK